MSYYQQIHNNESQKPATNETNVPPNVTTITTNTSSPPDKHTQIVSSLPKSEKAFRIPCVIRLNNQLIGLEQYQTQADQGSDLNVISMGLAQKLNLELLSLDLVGFRELTMRTADHKDTPLQFWVWLEVGVQQLWRKIRCFVSPSVINPLSSIGTEPLSLLLGIPWLYSERNSTIKIGDPSLGEKDTGRCGTRAGIL